MNEQINEIAEMLADCEENGMAPPYIVSDETYKKTESLFSRYIPVVTEPVKYSSGGEEIFVLSDLHIASGQNSVGVYRGTENFFADDSFGRFLKYADSTKKTKNAILIINGDVFDFLRVVEYPGRVRRARWSKRMKRWIKFDSIKAPPPLSQSSVDAQCLEWKQVLEKVGISKTIDELRKISWKEKQYGLKTHDYKSVWKLHLIQKGHTGFFNALAAWMENGNRLIIVKGNHDPEWYWRAIRNHFRLILAEKINALTGADLKQALRDTVLPGVTFIDDSILIDEDFYVEHGHRYSKHTMILGSPMYKPEELNIPFGSFFNRYFFNKVELFLPYLDNVRPMGNVLYILIKENFPLAMKVLFQHVLNTILSLNRKYIWFIFKKVFFLLLVLAVPFVLFAVFNSPGLKTFVVIKPAIDILRGIFDFIVPEFLRGPVLQFLKGFGLLFLSYIFTRFIAWLQLNEPDSLESFARNRSKDAGFKILTMGHTHNPGEYLFLQGTRFYNTGTWTPVIEFSNAQVREDKTYTFLHLERGTNGKLTPANNNLIQRWNDEAGRAETQILVLRK